MTVKPEHLGGDRWRIRVYSRAQRRQVAAYFHAASARQVKRLAAEHEARLRGDISHAVARRATLNGLIDDWCRIRDAKDSPSTVRHRQATIRRIRETLGPIRLEDLTAEHVDRWLADLTAQGLTDTTVGNHWSALRAILNQGDRWDRCSPRATKKATPPSRLGNRRPSPPTGQAIAVLIDTAPPTLRIAAMLAAYAGLRRGEVVGLRWSDIDWHNEIIHVRRAAVELDGGGNGWKPPKSGQTRDVAVDRGLLTALHQHRQLQLAHQPIGDDGPVVSNLIDGEGRLVGWVSHAWQRHARKVGANNVHFHDLRHFYATDALDAGVAPAVVQQQLGHLQQTTTLNIYGHAVTDGARKAAVKLGRRRQRALNP